MKMDSLAKSSTEFGPVTTVDVTNVVVDTTCLYSAETISNINVGSFSGNSTLEDIVWHMPVGILLATMVILTCELFLSILTNAALMLTICHSPNLKSPPNCHLINICATNFLLTFGMFFEVASTICSGHDGCGGFVSVSGGIQMMIDLTVFLQYWHIFSAIGMYRFQTIRRPGMSLAARRNFVHQSIMVGWLASLIIAAPITLTFHGTTTVIGWNAFRKVHLAKDRPLVATPKASQVFSLTALVLSISVNIVVICRCYYYLLKTFYQLSPRPKNSVFPTERQYSFSSTESINSPPIAYQISGSGSIATTNSRLFQISSATRKDSVAVQYCKKSKPAGGGVALDYPIRMAMFRNETGSQRTSADRFVAFPEEATSDSGSTPGFTDISAGAELHRAQLMKNLCALRNQSLRRERTNVKSTIKNSIVLIATFVLCSFPLFFCSVPSVLNASSVTGIHYSLLFSHLAFNVIAPAYPIWYILFSKRIRKCFQNLYEDILIKLHIK